MRRRLRWAAIFTIAFVNGAEAARCPYGQIYRVHLGECVSWRDTRARAYVSLGDMRKWRFQRFAPKTAPSPSPKPILIAAPIPPEAEWTDDPIETLTPIPDLLAGTPAFWRICAEHHEWCEERKPTE